MAALPASAAASAGLPVLAGQIGRYLGAVRKRWWILLLTMSLGFGGAAWYVYQTPPAYLSSGRLMVAGQMRIGEGAAYTEELVNFFGTQVEIMQSAEVRARAQANVQGQRPDLLPEKVRLEVGQVPRASIFIMRAIGVSPVYTQVYLQACMDEYMAKKKEWRSQKSESTTAAIDSQLLLLENDMVKQEEAAHDFQKTNNLGFLTEEGNSAGIYLAQLNRQAADLRTEYDLLGALSVDQNTDRQQVPGAGRSDAQLLNFGPLADYQRAKQQIQQLIAEKENLALVLRPKHPDIIALTEQIAKGEALLAAFRTQSVETFQSRRESILIQRNKLHEVIKEWEAKALDLSRRLAEFDKIKSTAERTKAQYDRLLASRRSVDVTTSVDQDTVSLLEKATPAISVRPGLEKIIAQGVGGGLLLGLLILFIIDRLDDRIRSFHDFRQHFDEALLGQIPHEKGKGSLPLLSLNDTRHALLESFRTVRSSLIFLPIAGARPKTILLTSAIPGEGKTTVSANLAASFAFSGAKVLLVDADLRRGRLHDLFRVTASDGFARVLQQEIPWRRAVVPTAIANLSLLPRGKSIGNATEHFLGGVADRFLQEVYTEYDYIIFDSAPVMVADDTLSFAPKIDATLFVVRFATSSVRMCRRGLENLLQRQVNVLGLIANDVKLAEAGYGYGRYYEYGSKQLEKEARAAG